MWSYQLLLLAFILTSSAVTVLPLVAHAQHHLPQKVEKEGGPLSTTSTTASPAPIATSTNITTYPPSKRSDDDDEEGMPLSLTIGIFSAFVIVISSFFIAACIHSKCSRAASASVSTSTQVSSSPPQSTTVDTAVGVVVDEFGRPIVLTEVTATGVPVAPQEGLVHRTTIPLATTTTPSTAPNTPVMIVASPYGLGSYYYNLPSSPLLNISTTNSEPFAVAIDEEKEEKGEDGDTPKENHLPSHNQTEWDNEHMFTTSDHASPRNREDHSNGRQNPLAVDGWECGTVHGIATLTTTTTTTTTMH